MFEGLVASVLARYLGDFIEVDQLSKDLKMSLLSGLLSLESVAIKRECLSFLGLPLIVKYGSIKLLELKVPLSRIGSEPVIIKVSGISLVVSPKYAADANQMSKNNQRKKMNWLEIDDLLEKSKAQEDENSEGSGSESSWSAKWYMQRIYDNVQLHLNNIKIRYEDDITIPKTPFVAGINIDRISLESTDEGWVPKFISGGDESFRMITIGNFSAYWNIGQFEEITTLENLERFSVPLDEFLVAPVNAKAKLTINKNHLPTPDKPKIKANIEVEDFTVNLNDKQYKQVFSLLDVWYAYSKSEKHRIFRPSKTPHENPKAWWAYAST